MCRLEKTSETGYPLTKMRIQKIVLTLFLLSSFVIERPCQAGLSTKTQIPEFFAVTQWLNSDTPVTRQSLEGNVVIISFWNFSCLDCIKQMAVLDSWRMKYQENHFKVITIHTPFYDFEKHPENVEQAIKKIGFPLIVGVDAEGLMWRAYNRPAKPVYYMVDGRGRIRAQSPEQIDYAKEEAVLQDLLREQGEEILDKIEKKPSKTKTATERIILGFQDLSHYGNETKPRAEIPLTLKKPADLKPGFYALSGNWVFHENKAMALSPRSELSISFQGSRVFLIAGSPRNNPVRLQIVIDGQALTKQTLGRDAKIERGDTYLEVKDDGLYETAKNLKADEMHLLEVVFEDAESILYGIEFD